MFRGISYEHLCQMSQLQKKGLMESDDCLFHNKNDKRIDFVVPYLRLKISLVEVKEFLWSFYVAVFQSDWLKFLASFIPFTVWVNVISTTALNSQKISFRQVIKEEKSYIEDSRTQSKIITDDTIVKQKPKRQGTKPN